MNIYDIKAVKMNGKEVSLEEYKGKVLLIVNTASKCGFTRNSKGWKNYIRNIRMKDLRYLDSPVTNLRDRILLTTPI